MKSVLNKSLRALLIAAMCILLNISLCLGQQTISTSQKSDGTILENRWFFSFGYGRTPSDVEKIKSLIDRGAAHGLNGMVLSSFGLDRVTRWNETDIALLREVADYCAMKQIELIPIGLSVGYGGGAIDQNRNFAAALPGTVSLIAKEGKLIPVDADNLLINGDLEAHIANDFDGFSTDLPGEISFADSHAASGKASIRFENFGVSEHGHGRIIQKVEVRPGRTYRFTFKLKTQDVNPVSEIKAMVFSNGRSLASVHPTVKSTQDWTEVTLDYTNMSETEVLVYAGIWGGVSGEFWLDDLRFFELGSLSEIVRREGTPLELKSRDSEAVFVEGKDYEAIRCLPDLKHVTILPGTSIMDGEYLELSCYTIPYVTHSWGRQTSLCMSNPELYDYWAEQLKRLHQIIPFTKFLLSMDEIRQGGGCELCRARGISMAEILGDCITRQHDILKNINPEIEVLIWSDMIDPAHNARGNYYGVVGDFTGSWKYVPRDLTIICWYHKIRDTSLEFFSAKGFHTFGASYYDTPDLTTSSEWLLSLSNTPNAQGIMYTTWLKKYELLEDFGDLVSDLP